MIKELSQIECITFTGEGRRGASEPVTGRSGELTSQSFNGLAAFAAKGGWKIVHSDDFGLGVA